MTSPDGTVCVIVGSWPKLSTTFIAQELVGLERNGLRLWLASLKPGDPISHALHDEIQAPLYWVPRYPPTNPTELIKAYRHARRRPGYRAARALLRADGAWLKLPKRLHFFTQALMIASRMPEDTRAIYVHFMHKPGTVGRYLAALTGLPLAGSAHARDIWLTSDAEKRAKLESMEWLTTCNGPALDKLRSLAEPPDKIHLVYHGLSLKRFPQEPPERDPRDGTNPDDPIRLLSVGRAVEKKGFDVLLNALADLPRDIHWRWHHIGQGPILKALRAQAERLGINDRIIWHGAQRQSEVIEQYRNCDLFVFPGKRASDGDQDGLPNVLMEAQTQALACLSTRFSAIPELIRDGETGWLVEPDDVASLRAALQTSIRNPKLREQIGRAGYDRVRAHFQAESGIAEIASLLRGMMARAPQERDERC